MKQNTSIKTQVSRYALRVCTLACISIFAGCLPPLPPPSLPSDLAVSGLSLSSRTVEVGSNIDVSVNVSNIGASEAPASTLRFYRNPSGRALVINENSTLLSTLPVPAIPEDMGESYTTTFTAPNIQGSYYFGVCVDAVLNEEREENNCTSLQEVIVIEPLIPDLVPQTPLIPQSVFVGRTINIALTVSNAGTAPASASTLRFYLANSSVITVSDTVVGNAAQVPTLNNGSSSPILSSGTITAPSTPGTYYYGACVGAVPEEVNTSNNCTTGAMVVVNPLPTPDIVPQNLSVSSQSVSVGQTISISVEVRNDGSAPATDGTVQYYQSSDSTISSSDTQVGMSFIGFLSSGDTSRQFSSAAIGVPSTPGRYYYGVCVNGVSSEEITANNCLAG